MKNVLKKIAATAMAFTLLGTGTAIVKTVSPKSDNTLIAKAHHYSYGENYHTIEDVLNKTSEKKGNYIYIYQWYGCDCGFTWCKIIGQYRYNA